MKAALTGASGFVGRALQKEFDHIVIIERDDSVVRIIQKLKEVDIVINLAGAPIIKRWNDPYKRVLKQSRIHTTERLVKAVNQSNIKHFISTSAIGIYPDDIRCDEACDIHANDFLGELSQAWEYEAHQCTKPTVILRFGVVLGKEGGALAQMLTPFRLGVGGIIGNGQMMTSWIDIDDLIGIYRFVIEKGLTGTYNAVSPNPVSNYVFTKALGKVLHRPTVLPIPEFALRIMYGEAASVLTGSKEVYPKAIEEAGYQFKYPVIEESLEHLLNR